MTILSGQEGLAGSRRFYVGGAFHEIVDGTCRFTTLYLSKFRVTIKFN